MARPLRPFAERERFDPLKPENIGAMLRSKLEGLDLQKFPHDPFLGAGLYALYYEGNFPVYERITDCRTPIYVGKAEAGNSSYGFDPDYNMPKLTDRIKKHSQSVKEVEASGGNISRSEFRVRALSLEDAWIVLGERALLQNYRPVLWNTIMNGFGSNEPGVARSNSRSVWDTIHPGRSRAGYLPNRRFTLKEMKHRIAEGIAISTMDEGLDRKRRLRALERLRPPVIWAPPKRGAEDQRIRVAEMPRFMSEVERMGLTLSPDRYVQTEALPATEDSEQGDLLTLGD